MQIQTSNATLVYNQTQWPQKKTTKQYQVLTKIKNNKRLLYMAGVHKNGYNHLGKLCDIIY